MHITAHFAKQNKISAIAIMLLLSSSQLAISEEKQAEVDLESISSIKGHPAETHQEPIYMQRELSDVSAEHRSRLRRDLDNYSRSLDPVHTQIEQNRALMRKRLQERFFTSDKDNNGKLSRIEAAEMMPQIARHFSQVDLNHDETITMNELAVAQSKAIARLNRENAQLEALEKTASNKSKSAPNAENKQAASSVDRAL